MLIEIKKLFAVIALFQISSPSGAAKITPPGYAFFTGNITANVAGVTRVCTANLVLDASPNHYGDAHGTYHHTDVPAGTLKVTSFTLSGTGCDTAKLLSMPYTVSIGYSPSIVPLSVVSINALSFLPGVNCNGSVLATFSTLTRTINIPYQTIGYCSFQGSLTTTMFQIQN